MSQLLAFDASAALASRRTDVSFGSKWDETLVPSTSAFKRFADLGVTAWLFSL
jgi:hypothetical protein